MDTFIAVTNVLLKCTGAFSVLLAVMFLFMGFKVLRTPHSVAQRFQHLNKLIRHYNAGKATDQEREQLEYFRRGGYLQEAVTMKVDEAGELIIRRRYRLSNQAVNEYWAGEFIG